MVWAIGSHHGSVQIFTCESLFRVNTIITSQQPGCSVWRMETFVWISFENDTHVNRQDHFIQTFPVGTQGCRLLVCVQVEVDSCHMWKPGQNVIVYKDSLTWGLYLYSWTILILSNQLKFKWRWSRHTTRVHLWLDGVLGCVCVLPKSPTARPLK